MFVQSPFLRPGAIPETDAVQAGKDSGGKFGAGIMPFGEGVELDLPFLHRANLRCASVNRVRFAPDLVNGIAAGLFHRCLISFAERICKNQADGFCAPEFVALELKYLNTERDERTDEPD